MKSIISYTRTQNGALAGALILLVVGCGFALLHAFTGAGEVVGMVAPLFVPA